MAAASSDPQAFGILTQAKHAAHLAVMEGALLALLREAGEGEDPNDQPDAISVRLDGVSIEVEFYRGVVCVGALGL